MSKITAILPVRNEDWVIGLSIRALLLWCDEVIAFNHRSDDRTLDILHEIQGEDPRLIYFSGTDPTWHEMKDRQRLLECARERKATHIVTIDADEVVTGTLLSSMREVVLGTPTGRILQLPWLQLRGSICRFITGGIWSNNRASTAFADRPEWHWETQNGGYDHHHRHPMGLPMVPWHVVAITAPMMQRLRPDASPDGQPAPIVRQTVSLPAHRAAALAGAQDRRATERHVRADRPHGGSGRCASARVLVGWL